MLGLLNRNPKSDYEYYSLLGSSAPPSSTYVAPVRPPPPARASLPKPESEEELLYREYQARYAKRLMEDRIQRERNRDAAAAAGTLPEGSLIGTEYDPLATSLLDGRRPASLGEFAKHRAGIKDIAMGTNLWFPEEKELKDAGILRNAAAGVGELTYTLTEPARTNFGLETKDSKLIRAAQITQNIEMEQTKEKLKDRLRKGEELSDEEAEWLAENDKGFFAEFVEGIKSMPDLVEALANDPDIRREFFNDMVAQLPPSMLISRGMGTALGAAKNIMSAAKNLNNARKFAKIASKSKAAKAAKAAVEFANDQVADAAAEGINDYGQGGDFNFGRNLGEGFVLDGALQSGIRVGAKVVKKVLGGKKQAAVQDAQTIQEPEGEPRFQFIGQKGAENLGQKESLYQAFAMQKSGKDEKAIKLATGWEKGADGEWRHEVPDMRIDESKIKTANDMRAEGFFETNDGYYRYNGKLHDLIENKELFDAYPELKDIEVDISEWGLPWEPAGYFDKENNRIRLVLNNDYYKKNMNSTIAHEIQHAIQTIEGFTPGSSDKFFENKRAPVSDFTNDLQKAYDSQPPRSRKKFHAWLADNVSKIDNPELKQFVTDYKKGLISEADYKERLRKEWEAYRDWKMKPFDLYYRTAGEVEARNVQKRIDYTPEQRRNTLASETEDVPRNRQIFADDGSTIYSLAEVAERQDFRDEHGAPAMEWDTLKEALKEGGSTNLSEVARGKHNQPKDYFDTMSRGGGPRGFMYDTPEGWESLAKIKKIERLIAEGKNRKKLTVKVYRAVPNDVKTDELIHHDWVTLSKKYAVKHGESRFGEGEYKIIEQDVPIRYLWWDGNDINEWGYDPSNEIRYQALRPEFANEIDLWDGKERKTFTVGSTSEPLKSIGVRDKDIIWHGGKIAEILNKHKGMTRDIIKQVPDILENPIIVLKSKTGDSRLSIFGEIYDENGAPVTAILELLPTDKGMNPIDLNIIASAYGKDTNPAGFIQGSDVLYIDPDKSRADSWFQGVGLQLPSDKTNYGPIGNIEYSKNNISIKGVPFSQLGKTGKLEGILEELGKNPSTFPASSNPTNNIQNPPAPIPEKHFNSLLTKLGKTALAKEVITDPAKMQQYLAEHGEKSGKPMQTPMGEVYGFATTDGRIFLDPAKMNANTPVHEYGHLWTDFVKRGNESLYQRLSVAARQSDFYKSLASNPSYSHLSEQGRTEEAIAHAIGNKGEGMYRNSMDKKWIRRLISELWEWIAGKLGLRENIRSLTPEQLESMNLGELAEGAAGDLLAGQHISRDPNRFFNF